MPNGFAQEIAEVQTILAGITNELHPALREFIHDEIQRRATSRLAPVVLAAALPEQDSSEQRARRIYLAAALELLTVALAIHKLLMLTATNRDSIDRALAGGTVLAGDYCFSRAASLAAQTEHPRVVAIFAELLQQLSEGNLRQIFDDSDAPFDEGRLLYQSGALAGATLAELSPEAITATAVFGERIRPLPHASNGRSESSRLVDQIESAGLADFQRHRWEGILLRE